ncbi:PfkB domain protein [Gluconacetobacter diazotrophicus PA1 5]|uniref:Carbohydrate kinase family protein n=1 Tax=Gluconacetobacter diazotrophicus TaxID=33996 RepID=A0A7W4I8F0_GLUDI|nr:carbohydrate kinase family protein [Gluconacetobacter diazotrophicus]ACI50695.1 PfkB domain protein [Gluconacetobacter diazotrophicus PA1 5]MBB2158146.1 carbohydrate kinase family protein [Gluconacetobacter diazotrophicus]
MSRVAVLGYASMDYVIVLGGAITPGRTSLIRARPTDGWPRVGGAPAFVSRAMNRGGIAHPAIISQVGDDALGSAYRTALQADGADVRCLDVVAGARTPVTAMIYDATGECACLYEPLRNPDGTEPAHLSGRQIALLEQAECVCLSVAPAGMIRQALRHARPDAMLAWIAKNDADAFPCDLAAEIAGRADIIFSSLAEADMVAKAGRDAPARPGQILIETRGRDGACIRSNGVSRHRMTNPVTVIDPSGAGDTLAGSMLAALIRDNADPDTALGAGMEAARAMLSERQNDKRA